MSYFLSIKKDRVVIERAHRDAFPYTVKSVDDFREYLKTEASRTGIKVEDLEMMASSSMDFPEEFTDNAETIALAKAIR